MEARRAAYQDPTGAQTSIVRNHQGLQLFLRKWPSPGTPKGLLVAVHGWTFTARYFQGLAEHLNKLGFTVWAHDLQGHGLSDAAHGIRGYARTLEDHVTDLELILNLAKEENPGLPVFMYAESMGGTIALQYARRCHLRQQSKGEASVVQGMVLASPVVRVAKALLPPPPVMWVLRLLSLIAPRLEIPDDSVKQGYLEAFGNKELGKQIMEDPLLTITRSRIGFATSVLTTTSQLGKHMEQVSIPFLVMHGPGDTRTELCNSQELLRRSQAPDKKLFSLDDMNHQLLQDKPEITARVLHEMSDWLLQRCQPVKA